MKNIVISLKTASERRQHIIKEFGKQNIAFEFFDAITPDLITNTSKNLGIDLTQNQRLSQGEKACFLSHLCLWQKMIDEDIDHMAIFEDDVYLGENANLFLNNEDWLNTINFDIIKLETWHELVHLDKKSIHLLDRQFKRLKSTHVGACGYIIKQSSAQTAINYIKSLPSDYIFAIDHVIFGALLKQLNIYQMVPALAIQADQLNQHGLISQLESERKNNNFVYQSKDSIFIKIKKVFQRLARSFGKRFYYQKIEFR